MRKIKNKYFSPENDNIESASRLLYDYISIRNRQSGGCDNNFEKKIKQNWLVLCIGTDRMTGDCLGPLVGTRLCSLLRDTPIYGTLKQPVHAGNLASILEDLRKQYPHFLFLTVDASTGSEKVLGNISISLSPLRPGKSFQKKLPAIGDICITGITGREGILPELVLPYSRLYLVDRQADFITKCILQCLGQYQRASRSSL